MASLAAGPVLQVPGGQGAVPDVEVGEFGLRSAARVSKVMQGEAMGGRSG